MIFVADGFSDYGKRPEEFTVNFENAPHGMSFQPFKIQRMDWANSPAPMESTCEAIENPDSKMLKFLQDWAQLITEHNTAPRYTVESGRKGAYVTFTKAPMIQLWFRSRRLAHVYAKKHEVSFCHGLPKC